MNPIKLALIGGGLIGQTHLKLIDASPACALVAICDPNPQVALLAEQYNVPFHQHIGSLLQSHTLDGAIIATPTHLHTEIGIICAEHGIHILVEKPIAATVADAHKLVEVTNRCGIQILVGHHRRHNPLVQSARAMVQRGDIGRLTAVSAHFLLQKPDSYYDTAWRTLRPGGGPALINLIHDLDNLRYICGDIRQVYAQMSSEVRGFAVEDTVSVSLSFENGALGTILASDTTPSPWSYELTSGENPSYPHCDESCYYFCGTEGSFAFPQMNIWHYTNADQAGWHEPFAQTSPPDSQVSAAPTDPLAAQIDHFCRVIRGEEVPLVGGSDAAKSLAVVLAILESAKTNQPAWM